MNVPVTSEGGRMSWREAGGGHERARRLRSLRTARLVAPAPLAFTATLLRNRTHYELGKI